MSSKKLIRVALVLGSLGYAALSVAAQVDYFMPNGQKVQGEVVGNKLMLKGGLGGTSPAPDGVYKSGDGKSIIVQKGIIVQGGLGTANPRAMKSLNPQPEPPSKPASPGATKGFNPQPDPPGKQTSKKPLNPAEVKGFNPQPDPPGKPSSKVIGEKSQK